MPSWPEWVATAAAIVGTASGAAAIWENRRRRRREAAADARAEEQAEGEQHLKFMFSALDRKDVEEKIVSVIISSERVRAYLREEGRAVFLEELVDSPSMVALREAISDMRENMHRIEDIFIQAGAAKLTSQNPTESRFLIKKDGQS